MSVITEKVLRPARTKLMNVVDQGTFCEMDKNLTSGNPLGFAGYEGKLEKEQKNWRARSSDFRVCKNWRNSMRGIYSGVPIHAGKYGEHGRRENCTCF